MSLTYLYNHGKLWQKFQNVGKWEVSQVYVAFKKVDKISIYYKLSREK